MANSDEYVTRWKAAMHAVQSGVAMEMERGSKDTEPKHLRVGINGALCDHGALVKLLVDKGVVTEEEYLRAIAESAEAEKARYEERLWQQTGGSITLA